MYLHAYFDQGFAIGNGLTNPEIQYRAYTDYALDMQLINQDDYDEINQLYPKCQQQIKLCGKWFISRDTVRVCKLNLKKRKRKESLHYLDILDIMLCENIGRKRQ